MKQGSKKISFQGLYEVITPLRGVILYPALGSPEVSCGEQDLNLLICLESPLPDSGDGAKQALALRLKFMTLEETRRFQMGLERNWNCHGAFPSSLIREINPLEFGGDPIISFPKNGFTAHLNPRTLKFFREGNFFDQRLPESIHRGFKKVYHVAISSGIYTWMRKNLGAELAARSYLNWLSTGSAPTAVFNEPARLREPEEESVSWLLRNFEEDGRNIFVGKRVKEASDVAQKRHTGLKETDPPICLYDIFKFQFKPDVPFAPLHPVFHFPEERPLNMAYISDLHVVSRMQVLKESNLSIIPGASAEDSPRLCDQMSTPGENVRNLLSKAATDDSIDVLVVGGDLIDFAQSCFVGDSFLDLRGKDGKIDFRKVQAKVNADKSNYSELYVHGVDYMAIFDLLSNFPKPVFILSGNHDAYDRPFGMSPRIKAPEWSQINAEAMANEGIPADANLTIMEACLLYGNNFGFVGAIGEGKKYVFNFNPAIGEIFSLLFTPVASFTARIGTLQWISLSWGADEQMFQDGPTFGHLPNANESLTSADLALVKKGVTFAKGENGLEKAPCLLLSHYTWASYDPSKALLDGHPRTFSLGDDDDATWHNVGTCMKNRAPIYKYLASRDIDIAVSGHAHRAGLYTLDSLDGKKATVRGYSVEKFDNLKKEGKFKKCPIILGADSAGPIPRENNNWEFNGWGSNLPSMLKLVFSSGELVKVERVQARSPKPRLAVAMDYLEALVGDGDKFWLDTIETVEFGMDGKEAKANPLTAISLNIGFGSFAKIESRAKVEFVPTGLDVKNFSIYLVGKGPLSIQKIAATKVGQAWKVDVEKLMSEIERKRFNKAELSGFISASLSRANSHGLSSYDDSSPWIQRVNIIVTSRRHSNGLLWKIRIKRDAAWMKMKNAMVAKYINERHDVRA